MKKHYYKLMRLLVGMIAVYLNSFSNLCCVDTLPTRSCSTLLPFEQEYLRIMHFYAKQEEFYSKQSNKEHACLAFFTLCQLRELRKILPESAQTLRLKNTLEETIVNIKQAAKKSATSQCQDFIHQFAYTFHETYYKTLLKEQLGHAVTL